MEGCQKTFVTRAGINVRYLEAGEGPAVLLVHGLATSKVTWYCNIDALVSGGYRVLALDLPGHGDSDKPKDLKYEPAGAVELIRQFLVELELDRVSLVGNSAGGLLVGLFSLAYPQQVEKLVLVAPGGLGRHVTWLLRFLSVPMLGELFYQPRLQSPYESGQAHFLPSSCHFSGGFAGNGPSEKLAGKPPRRHTVDSLQCEPAGAAQKKLYFRPAPGFEAPAADHMG